MRKTILILFTGIFCFTAHAQETNFWTAVDEGGIARDVFTGRFKPKSYRLFQLKESDFTALLGKAPSEVVVPASRSGFQIRIPVANGVTERFRLVYSPVMHPDLAARYPDIRSFVGQGVDHPSSTIRMDISREGMHAIILSPDRATIYIDPVDRADKFYVVFERTDAAANSQPFQCITDAAAGGIAVETSSTELYRNADDGRLRTYRLALAATGEYSAYFLNGTETTDAERKAKVLASMNTAITRTNAIYERDFGVRLQLIPSNDLIIYLTASTDPWSTEFNNTTQVTIDNVIGSANYDIGHLVHRAANNGNAGCIGCICKEGVKGKGYTSHTAPQGDPFIVDYLSHEIGHQFGANHTFSHVNEGSQWQAEPGSGSTIMGYAGITGVNTDIQSASDDYFHSRSIEQVTNYIKSGLGGGLCAIATTTGNFTPSAAAGADYYIPKSTPFQLSGSGTDADVSDMLTYGWEQIDMKTGTSPTIPSSTAVAGPQFRSVKPNTSNSRTFPILTSILDGTNRNKWEVLPGVQRIMNFRFMVRDNHSGGGNNKSDDMIVHVAASGPFGITAPSTPVTWMSGTEQSVSWVVNGTDAAPVNCTEVSILLSTDGGYTFPITLLSNTANDGSEMITVPAVSSALCRIKVQSVGNIFFDISDNNFIIGATAPTCGEASSLTAENITGTSASLSWTGVSGALSYTIDYRASASVGWTNAATGIMANTISLGGLNPTSVYEWRVRVNCINGTSNPVSAYLTTAAACLSAYESNETYATASLVPSNQLISAAIGSSSDRDWYKFTLLSTSQLHMILSNLPADYNFSFHTTDGNLITSANNTGVFEDVISDVTAFPGTYYLQVWGANGAYNTQACYTLNIQVRPICPGTFDVNGNTSIYTAVEVPFNHDILGQVTADADVDYYKFVVTTGGTVSLLLSQLPADYDLELLNGFGFRMISSTQRGLANESIADYYLSPGTYYAYVYGGRNEFNPTKCYVLRIITGTGSKVMQEQSIQNQEMVLFPNPATDMVQVTTETHIDGAVAEVYDVYGRKMMQQTVTGANFKLNTSRLTPGVYMIKVRNRKGETSTSRFIKE